MSNRPSQYAEYPQHHAHDHGRPQARRVAPAKPPTSHAKQSDYTIAHRGKQVRIGPVVFWIVVGTVTVLGAWSAATATYFAFRDDVLTKLIARQAEMQYAYEDRISELRAKIDRTTSRQMLDQEQFDQKLDQVMRRQTTLESRATALGAMPDLSVTGSIPKPPARGAAIDTNTSIPKPSPISDTVTFVAPPDREARLESRTPALAVPPSNQFAKLGGVDNVIGRLQASLDQVESRQMAALGAAEESMDSKVRRMRGAISDLGLNMAKLESATPRAAMGGPYVPVKLSANADPFERQLYRIQVSRAQMDKLNRTMALVPYRKPVVGEVEFTSGFGVRTDPFLGRPAMHTGLDFRAATGDPIRATANGKVSSAGWAGGYGQMVEVDHGNGLATRYGHMSKILVKVGDPIKIGQVIGLVGSTGRSTGSHLHYETRIDGEAVDPQKFLRAGVRLSAG
jgi:murein DD-endopeptidase MepM/ murein hydrolase activator NlpD